MVVYQTVQNLITSQTYVTRRMSVHLPVLVCIWKVGLTHKIVPHRLQVRSGIFHRVFSSARLILGKKNKYDKAGMVPSPSITLWEPLSFVPVLLFPRVPLVPASVPVTADYILDFNITYIFLIVLTIPLAHMFDRWYYWHISADKVMHNSTYPLAFWLTMLFLILLLITDWLLLAD